MSGKRKRAHTPSTPPPQRRTEIHDDFWDDLRYWIATDSRMTSKLLDLVEEIRRHPFEGTGLPEPLRYNLRGFWSRRLTDEHRIVYRVSVDVVELLSARYHYRR
ncbi:MAG TPA: Txe/YoeB family addiction module toxin [Longimicrobium sp.]|nr:Txe/YoeB family addiction module toxin [Longimicrobium sp.]